MPNSAVAPAGQPRHKSWWPRRFTEWRARFVADCYVGLLEPRTRVLDLGCGNGVVGSELRRRFDLDLVAADVEPRPGIALPFVLVPRSGALPFAAKSFRAVLLNDVLHHAVDQPGLIRRALVVGERVIAFEDAPGRAGRWLDWLINRLNYGGLAVGQVRDAVGWRRYLAENGLTAEVREVGRPKPWYPFAHLVIIVNSDVQVRPDRQLADRQLHP